MAKQNTFPEDKPMMVNEDAMTYPQGITIPITLPTTGDCSVAHTSWRNLKVSDKVKAMSLGPSSLSTDTRSDKELLTKALEEKYILYQPQFSR